MVNYEKLSIKELKVICKEKRIKQYSKMNKKELIEEIKKSKRRKIMKGGDGNNEVVLERSKLLDLLKVNNNKLINLVEIILNKNYKITKIEANTFNGLSNLYRLYLNNNKIIKLKSNTFNGLNELGYLWLNDNEITEIEPDSFNGLSKLKELWLRNNKIIKLKSNTFNGLSNLKELWLNRNKITEIEPDSFNGLSNLKELYLSSSGINKLQTGTFNGLSNLKELYLSNNKITEIQHNSFNGLNNNIRIYLCNSIDFNNYFKKTSNITFLCFLGKNFNNFEFFYENNINELEEKNIFWNYFLSKNFKNISLLNHLVINKTYNEINNIIKVVPKFNILSSNPSFETIFLNYFNIVREIAKGNYKKNNKNKKKCMINQNQSNKLITLKLKDNKDYKINKKTYIELCKESGLISGLNLNNNEIILPEITEENMKLIETYLIDELSENDFNNSNEGVKLKKLIDLFLATDYLGMDLYNLPVKLFFKILKIIINNK
jgi:hypothetical protein